MQLRIDIEDASGNKLGPGPLTTATNWHYVNRLDKAGEFSFRVPAADSRTALLVAHNRVRAFLYVDGAWQEQGYGIIDQVDYDGSAQPTWLTVSGGNIARELAWRVMPWYDPLPGMLTPQPNTVHLAEAGYASPVFAFGLHVSPSSGGMVDDSGSPTSDPNAARFTPFPNAIDGNSGTSDTIDFHSFGHGSSDWGRLYLCYPIPYPSIHFAFQTIMSSTGGSWSSIQYYSVDPSTGIASWKNLLFSDGTNNSGTWRQDGDITFIDGMSNPLIPSDWSPLEQLVNYSGSFGSYQYKKITGYWVRLQSTLSPGNAATIKEITVKTRVPTLTGPQRIIAGAPAGWALDSAAHTYNVTAQVTLLNFQDTTVLAGFTKLGTALYEHWRVGDSRVLSWLQRDYQSSGVAAERVDSGLGIETNPWVCAIRQLRYSVPTFDLMTRIIPYGAGLGTARITLAQTTRDTDGVNPLPGGYTFDRVNNQIINGTAESTYGEIDSADTYPDIAPASTAAPDIVLASNALWDVALWKLKNSSAPVPIYDLTCVSVRNPVLPGQTLHVRWREIINAYAVLNLDTDLIVLETTTDVDEQGIRTVSFKVSTLAQWPMSEQDVIAQAIQRQYDGSSFNARLALELLHSSGTSGGTVVSTGTGGVYSN